MRYNVLVLLVLVLFNGGCVLEVGVFDPATGDRTGFVYHDVNGNGARDVGERGIGGVMVSNGVDVVSSDGDGGYELAVSDDCIVFVIKPAGWKIRVDEDNLPMFYYINKPGGSDPGLRFAGIAPTGTKPASIDFGLQRQRESEKFEVVLFGDIQSSNAKEVVYFRRQLGEVIGTKAAFGVSLGDNVGDNLSELDEINEAVATVGLTWYNVAGNHDMNYLAADDKGSLETFKSIYGPVNYSFNYGKAHFVVLDSIIAKRGEGERLGYDEGLGAEALSFLANDLEHVGKDKLVVLLMHGGLQYFSQDRDILFAILKDFERSFSIAGHDHFLRHIFYGESENFGGRNPHHYFVAGAVCGSWWMGTPDPYTDTPHSMMYDGAPSGYTMLRVDGNEYSLKYKAFGKPADFQMTVYAPDEVKIGEVSEAEVVANVFAASGKARVEMRVDSSEWAAMSACQMPDPYFVKVTKWEEANDIHRYGWAKEPRKLHIWKAPLAGNLSKGMHIINVRSTDIFGQTFSVKRLIKVTE